jgi:hypothetical protein
MTHLMHIAHMKRTGLRNGKGEAANAHVDSKARARQGAAVVIDLAVFNGEPFAAFRMEYAKSMVDLFVVIECKESVTEKVVNGEIESFREAKPFYHLGEIFIILSILIIF